MPVFSGDPFGIQAAKLEDFYKFTVDDFMIEDYQAGPQIKNIPIAI